jgi:DNA polymerase II small subunit
MVSETTSISVDEKTKEKIVKYFQSRDLLVTPKALGKILDCADPLSVAKKIRVSERVTLVTEEDVEVQESGKFENPEVIVKRPASFKPLAKEIESRVEVDEDSDVTGKSLSEGTINDFIDHFRDRLDRVGNILRERGSFLSDIGAVRRNITDENVRIIGMVTEVKVTKNGHRIIRIEDSNSNSPLPVFVHRNCRGPLSETAERLIEDEVIGVEGKMRNDLFIANEIIQPDVPNVPHNRAGEGICLAMLSDTHVGSSLFMEKNFQRVVAWLRGEIGDAMQRELAGKVKYVTIAGDLVDGVGIYPDQEDELLIKDIVEQYDTLLEYLQEIPDYIEIIICPGNHDGVRLADPQPRLTEETLGDRMNEMHNLHSVSSPCYVELHGVRVLMYHGTSMDSMITNMSGLDYDHPERSTVEWLRRRHLHLLYGQRPPITPEKRDYMVIEKIPDIVHSGHVHRNGYDRYKGIAIVNSGTWQSTTPYQVRMGHHPTPCILPVMNLQSGNLSVMHFDREVTGG